VVADATKESDIVAQLVIFTLEFVVVTRAANQKTVYLTFSGEKVYPTYIVDGSWIGYV
jgi:hypothetical protein